MVLVPEWSTWFCHVGSLPRPHHSLPTPTPCGTVRCLTDCTRLSVVKNFPGLNSSWQLILSLSCFCRHCSIVCPQHVPRRAERPITRLLIGSNLKDKADFNNHAFFLLTYVFESGTAAIRQVSRSFEMFNAFQAWIFVRLLVCCFATVILLALSSTHPQPHQLHVVLKTGLQFHYLFYKITI